MSGYGDDGGFTAWMAANGYTLPGGAPTAAVLRQRGSTYVDGTYGLRFPGTPTGGAGQEREWPRTGAVDRYGTALDAGTVPQRVIDASYMAAYQEAVTPGSLSVVVDPSKRVKRQKVDTIEREFFGPGDASAAVAPVMSAIEGVLAPLLLLEPIGAGIGVVVV
jgi:hypothetical protein